MALSKRAVRVWYLVHKWSSLICMAFMLLLCLTGLPLIFHSEIDQWSHAEEYASVADDQQASLDQIMADSKAEKPGWELVFLVWDDTDPIIRVVMGETMKVNEGSAYFLTFDRRTGERLKAPPPNEGIMFFLLDLHGTLLMGLPGALFLGLMGVLFAVSVISGIVVYAPYMKRLPFTAVRRERGARIKWLDIHNATGMATVSWVLVVGITGIILTLVQPLSMLWQQGQLADIANTYRGTTLEQNAVGPDQVRAALLAEVPDADISFMSMPGSPYATPHHYTVALRGNTPLTERLIKLAVLDAATGQLDGIRSTPWYLTMVNISVPLHFGDYGGLPLKIIWALLDILAIFTLGSGIYLWLARGSRGVRRVEEIHAMEEETLQQQPVPGANG
ncbi:PepSY-associated TM helix domain-containing protein [Oceanobacter mangrovi]|uniref:PepSY-associated TM helix domain-containing protein n=1 Tax=Oceanobacter mangrovi TaxID=2862510 RepID=UPI001C8D5CFE|nr:PepSY domain-containing protein [Oceanobacter mangrovi]